MTRCVTFIMPGYKIALLNDEVINESDTNLQLTFDENLFIEMIQDLDEVTQSYDCNVVDTTIKMAYRKNTKA